MPWIFEKTLKQGRVLPPRAAHNYLFDDTLQIRQPIGLDGSTASTTSSALAYSMLASLSSPPWFSSTSVGRRPMTTANKIGCATKLIVGPQAHLVAQPILLAASVMPDGLRAAHTCAVFGTATFG